MDPQAGPIRVNATHKSTSSRRRMSRHVDDVRFHQLTEEEEREADRDDRICRKNAIYVDESEISSRGADGLKSSIQDQLDTEPCPHAPNCNFVKMGACIYKWHPGQEIEEHDYYTAVDPKTSATEKVIKVVKELQKKFSKGGKESKLRLLVSQIMSKK